MTEWLPLAPWVFGVACLVTCVAGIVQGTIGFGFGVICVPILSLVDDSLAPVPQLVLVLPLSLTMVLRERKSVDIRGVAWILAGRIPGAALGLLALKLASDRNLDFLLGFIVLTAVVAIAGGFSVPRNAYTKFAAGTLSGIFSLVSSIGGPPVALLYREEKGPTIRASLALMFLVGLFITIGTRVAAHEMPLSQVIIGLTLLPSLGLGLFLSGKLTGRVEGKPLKIGILIVAGIAGTAVLAKAVFS